MLTPPHTQVCALHPPPTPTHLGACPSLRGDPPHPLTQVRALHYAVTSLLKRCMQPSNVFHLLLLGRAISCTDLEEAARMVAVACFPRAIKQDHAAYLRLDVQVLMQLLANSNLQVWWWLCVGVSTCRCGGGCALFRSVQGILMY